MGQISAFDLQPFINEHQCKIYFETGTGEAISLSYALKYGFEEFYTVDVDENLIKQAQNRILGYRNLHFIHDFSNQALKNYLPKIEQDKSILFFLDAHFPGADFHKISYEQSMRHYGEQSLPLLKEIDIIKSTRDISKDVFIIDDWKLYDPTQNYEAPIWDYRNLQVELGLAPHYNEIINQFKETHNYAVDLRHQGYLILTPKN